MFLQQALNALQLGSIYALIALGYTMVYGVLRLINFAHGDIFMVGSYVALFLATVCHFPLWLILPFTFIATALLGVSIERLAYKPLRSAPRVSASRVASPARAPQLPVEKAACISPSS